MFAGPVDVADVIGPEMRHPRGLVGAALQQSLAHQLLDGRFRGRPGHFVVAGHFGLGQRVVVGEFARKQSLPQLESQRVDYRERRDPSPPSRSPPLVNELPDLPTTTHMHS